MKSLESLDSAMKASVIQMAQQEQQACPSSRKNTLREILKVVKIITGKQFPIPYWVLTWCRLYHFKLGGHELGMLRLYDIGFKSTALGEMKLLFEEKKRLKKRL
jgi:hypothetical protein